MQKRKLGQSALEVPPLTVGGNVFGWTVREQDALPLLDAFLDAGLNFIDTADSYSRWVAGNKGGESETIIGKWIRARGNRDKVIIATKVGSDMGQHNGKKVLKKSYILQAAEDSLRRLQTDYIDLYQSHYDDPDTPVEETLEAYAELVKAGKVRFIGASNFSSKRLAASLEASKKHGYPVYQSIQPEYNLYDRAGYEKELEPLVLETGIGVINYYALASGFLSGKYRTEADLSKSARGPGIKKYLDERGQRILKALDETAQRYKSTPAGISLAWLMARPGITAPIASATSERQIAELAAAAGLELDEAAIALLDKASAY
ncbi:aldo/keto reductase [Compostibacter hankyongensis]|uniref:Aldo/keto reductase n=1 Tax=Compostibacter hankyongensis TaxID=1007089 RepID=A0ABP8FY39_9BACT